MEDTIIIEALKEGEKGPNHQSPLKPIQKLKMDIDKLSKDVSSIKNDIKIILDHINYQDRQKQKGYWW